MKVQEMEQCRFVRCRTEEMLRTGCWKRALCLEAGGSWALDCVDKETIEQLTVWGSHRDALERCQKKFGAYFGEKLYLRRLDWENCVQKQGTVPFPFPAVDIVFGVFLEEEPDPHTLLELSRKTYAEYVSLLLPKEDMLVMEMQSGGMDLVYYRDYSLKGRTMLRMDFQKIF